MGCVASSLAQAATPSADQYQGGAPAVCPAVLGPQVLCLSLWPHQCLTFPKLPRYLNAIVLQVTSPRLLPNTSTCHCSMMNASIDRNAHTFYRYSILALNG